jgi:transposase
MAKTRPPYRPEFRRQIVDLVRAGRSPEELAQVCDGAANEELGRPGGV